MNLDAPPPRPGFCQKWIRAEFRSEADNLNWQSAMRQGYKPRDPATVSGHEAYFGDTQHKGVGVIRVGGLVLCEIPEQMVQARRRAIREVAQNQERSVAMETDKVSREGMRQGAPPIIREERETSTTGRRPETMAD